MASRQKMGVAGDVRVTFKIGRKYSFTHKFVVCENLTRPFILGADFMNQHYMKLGWAPGKKRTLDYLDETIAVASQEVTNEPLVLTLFHIAYMSLPCPCCMTYIQYGCRNHMLQ